MVCRTDLAAREERKGRTGEALRQTQHALGRAVPQRQWGARARPHWWGALAPAEQSLDVGELEFDVRGPAVVALARVGCRLHLTQQCVHFLSGEPTAGAHAAVASHGGADGCQALLEDVATSIG